MGWGESLDGNSNQTSHHTRISFAKPATCQMWNFKFPRLKSGELFLPQWIVWVANKLCKTPGPAQRWHTARGCVGVPCSRDCCQPPSHEDILLNYTLEPLLFYVSYLGLQPTWNWFLFMVWEREFIITIDYKIKPVSILKTSLFFSRLFSIHDLNPPELLGFHHTLSSFLLAACINSLSYSSSQFPI